MSQKIFSSISYQSYPKNLEMPQNLKSICEVFNESYESINSNDNFLKSNEVLNKVSGGLKNLGFSVEEKIDGSTRYNHVPVLFGQNGTFEKTFKADAYNKDQRTVIEVEAGRGVLNNQFLKDLFQACMMVNVDYLVIAVKNTYITKTQNDNVKISYDFNEVIKFFDALYASDRLVLPLKNVLVIGY